jgi:Lon-like protease
MPRFIRWNKRRLLIAALLAVIIGILTMYPLPYFLKTPGPAETLKGRVSIEGSNWEEKGDFLFTTVLQFMEPSILEYLYVKLTEDYWEKVPVEQAIGNVSNVDAYNQLTEWMRVNSEASAVIAAFDYMNKPVTVEKTGVIIKAFLEGSPASKLLHEGDIIIGVDGQPITTVQELAERLKAKKKGDSARIQVTRGKKTSEVTVPVMELDEGRVGIGFYHDQVQLATPSVPVRFKLEDIGGPSAGMMLSLDIISKVEQKDYTRGRKIAGTGTIDADGRVGQIGGIRFKLIAASKEGAEYFLLPKDIAATDGNQKEAEAFIKTLDTTMKLVPVATLQEAADFLASLPQQ